MQKISSKENSLIKHIKKLKEKKYRDEYNEFIIEGTKMLKEALKENAKIDKIVFSESFIENNNIEEFLSEDISPKDIICVPDGIFEMITEVGTPQGTLAIIKKEQERDMEDLKGECFIALDDLQDPGNLGTILRTADSANIKNIF